MELPRKMLVYIINEAKAQTNPGRRNARRVRAVEFPLRMRAANLGGISARKEKLNALNASALKVDLQRVEQMMEGLPTMQKALVADTTNSSA